MTNNPRHRDNDEKTAAQAQMLANRLDKRYKHLKKWAKRTGCGAFRLYDKDIPEIPLVLDVYHAQDGYACCDCCAYVAGALYERPYDKDEADEAAWLSAMKEAVGISLNVPPERIFLKTRSRRPPERQYTCLPAVHGDAYTPPAGAPSGALAGALACTSAVVAEGDLLFNADFAGHLDTGLFPEARLVRAKVRQAAAGKRLLNLFAYTGAFSVYAASGGGVVTDSVDLSVAYLERAAANFRLNGLDARITPPPLVLRRAFALPPHRLIRADALRFVDAAVRAGLRWDIIVLDPPAFSNSRRMSGVFDARRDWRTLVAKCGALLAPDGWLYLSIKGKGFHIDADVPGMCVTDITEEIRDEDFAGKRLPPWFVVRAAVPNRGSDTPKIQTSF
jgi:23S rRNA G2069 N7-methylase RlmK/C1962 C5-methylase RlmI